MWQEWAQVCKLVIKAWNLANLFFQVCWIQKCQETRDILAGSCQKFKIQDGRQKIWKTQSNVRTINFCKYFKEQKNSSTTKYIPIPNLVIICTKPPKLWPFTFLQIRRKSVKIQIFPNINQKYHFFCIPQRTKKLKHNKLHKHTKFDNNQYKQ